MTDVTPVPLYYIYSPVAQLVEQMAVKSSPKRGEQAYINMGMMDKRKYSDRREYLIQAVPKQRKKLRQKAVDYKGGKCERCGYNRCIEALEFHHKDTSSKDFSISAKGYTRSWLKVKEELDKCSLLCANCHREVHVQNAASSGNAG